MGTKFQISNQFIDIDSIKEYRIENAKYIYRPQYLKNKTLTNKISHKVYTFKDMVPYKPFENDIILEEIPYEIINTNNSIDEEKGALVKKSTQEFHYTEVRNIDCLIIVADREYVFYGSGIDCISAKVSLKHLELLIKNNQKSTKSAEFANKLLTDGQSFTKKGIAWFKSLNSNSKTLVGCVIFFVVMLLICFVGAATEDEDSDKPITIETTVVAVSESTTKESPTTQTTEVITTEESTTEEVKQESTTELITKAIIDVVEDNTKTDLTEQIEYSTEKKSGRTVYTTPTGEKYHCSSACAGRNAIERDYNDVEGVYEPCKKCAY